MINQILKDNTTTFFRIVIIIAATVWLVCVGGCGPRKKPSAAIEDMVRMVERGEIAQAMTCNSQGFISRAGIDNLKESLRQTALWIKRDGGIKSIEVLKEETVGNVAEVTMKVTRGGGDSSVVYYKLIWENGDWKIDDVASEPTSPPAATPSVSL